MKKVLYFSVILLCVFSLCGCNSEKIAKDKKETEKQEKKDELTEDLKKSISEKLAILFFDTDYEYGEVINNNELTNYTAHIFTNELTESDKTSLIIRGMKATTAKFDVANAELSNSKYKQQISSEAEVYSGEEFAKIYKNVFGEEPQYADVEEGCPSFIYDKNSKQYVSIVGCGGAGFLADLVYIDNITMKDNRVIVNTYVGYHTESPDDIKKTYSDRYDSSTAVEVDADTITSENKKSFAKYDFIFEKSSDGDYYFSEVTKSN